MVNKLASFDASGIRSLLQKIAKLICCSNFVAIATSKLFTQDIDPCPQFLWHTWTTAKAGEKLSERWWLIHNGIVQFAEPRNKQLYVITFVTDDSD